MSERTQSIRLPPPKEQSCVLDESAFATLIEEHRPMLARVVASYERQPALQEELMQEIILAIWRALPKFQGSGSVTSYLLSIAHKRAVSHVASQVRRREQSGLTEEHVVSKHTPVSQMDESQRRQALLKALQKLPMGDRQLVTLALEGLSYQQIAHILELSVSNVGVRLNRAKARLIKEIAGEKSP